MRSHYSLATIIVLACIAAAPTTQPIAGTLLDVDGKPAADVKVVAIADGFGADVIDGEILDDADGRPTKTDANGRWSFGPATRPVGYVLAVTKSGRAFAMASDFVDADKAMRAVALSYIEGVVRIRGKVGGNEMVKAFSLPTDFGIEEGQLGTYTTTVKADAAGHFRVPVLPGEEAYIGRVQDDDHFGDNIPRRVTVLMPKQGDLHLDLGGDGRLVNFHVAVAPGLKFDRAFVYMLPDIGKIDAAAPDWPADSVRWDKAKQEVFLKAWKESDAGKAAIEATDAKYRARNYYYGSCEADGNVTLQDVIPGNYFRLVSSHGTDAAGKPKRMEVTESGKVMIIAPAKDDPDAPQTLKELTLGVDHTLYAGDVPPALDLPSLDPDAPPGTRVKLSDFAGKVTLVHFWATWCGPCRAATPTLKTLEERFGSNPRFASVHVTVDDTMPPAQRYVFAEQLGGTHAWADPTTTSKLVESWGASAIPTMVLIGADGKVIKSVNDPTTLEAEIEAALAKR